MMKGKLVRRLMGEPKGSKKDFLHSSVYAKAQNKDGIGVASTETFGQRQEMERNRTTVRGYRDSLVAEQRSRRPIAIKQDETQKTGPRKPLPRRFPGVK